MLKSTLSELNIFISVFETEVKAGMTILEDPDAITDDDIDMVYARYIQSEFIKHMSEKVQNTQHTVQSEYIMSKSNST